MAEQSKSVKHRAQRQISHKGTIQQKEAIQALARLREIGKHFPPVDAVAIVRESRNQERNGAQ